MFGGWRLAGFNSLEFVLVFLPFAVAAHTLVLRRFGTAGAKTALLVTSVAFYLLSSASTLPVLGGSLLFNFWCVRRVAGGGDPSPPRRRRLAFGLFANVALLGVIKYSRFFADSVSSLTSWHPQVPAFVLPLGVSFFTLQQIMYLVDCYEGLAAPVPLLEHALFISFFPYVSAGPIVHASGVLPQLDDQKRVRDDRFAAGLVRFVIGLGKKVILAELFDHAVSVAFSGSASVQLVTGWMAAVSYAFQVYFDFSGYTDMAIGTALMLGVTLPENFNSPLASASIIDFWKRWHMTLTGFITTYLYTPMARRMRPLTFRKAMLCTVIAMTIVGLWHGAAWTYVLFGLLHGAALVANNAWRKTKRKLQRPLAWGLTFTFLVTSFVIFRAPSIHQALHVLSGMIGVRGLGVREFGGLHSPVQKAVAIGALIVGFATLRLPNSGQFVASFRPSKRYAVAFAGILVFCLIYLNSGTNTGFIYRDF